MSLVARCCWWVVVFTVVFGYLPSSGKPPLLSGPRNGRVPTAQAAKPAAEDLGGLWRLFDAAANQAYQEQAYRDSAAICLVGYLIAEGVRDQGQMFRSARLMAFNYHFLGEADLALGAYRLTLDNVIPDVIVELNDDGFDSRVADLDVDHSVAKTLLNVGVLCTNARKMDSAERYFLRVIKLAKLERSQTKADQWFVEHMLARAHSGLADLHAERFAYDESIPLYEESRKIFEAELNYIRFRERAPNRQLPFQERMGTKVDLAHCLGSLGGAYLDKPKPNLIEARKSLEASLRLRQELKNNVYIADSEILLSKLELVEHRYDQAYALAVSAAALTAPGSEGDNPDIHWQALLAEGQCLLKLDRLAEAEAPLKEAITTVENLKDPGLGSDEKSSFFNSVTWFFRQKVSPYVAMAELLVRQDKPLEALRYAELAKARTLLLGRPAGAIRKGGSLASNAVTLDKLTGTLVSDIPDQSTATLEYLRGIDRNYVFLVRRDTANRLIVQVRAIESPLPASESSNGSSSGSVADVDVSIEAFRNQIEKSYAAFPKALGEALYTELVKPFEKELADKTHLIIVPIGKLWELPFQALVVPKDGPTSYLMESYSISYTPSLLFLDRLQSRGIDGSLGRKVLLFENLISNGQDSGPSVSAFGSLKAALNEEPQILPTTFFLGPRATRDLFLQEAPGSKLILFSTHAIVGSVDPTQSYFLLTPESGENTNIGRLTAADIMSEQLSADLVVLVACETELGRYVEGEGEVGLGWAFLYAGCASTVVSQWKIDRDASLDLTARFCRALVEELRAHPAEVSLADLLRSTQLKLLSDDRYSHPSYWAGMVLVGDPYWRSSAVKSRGAPSER
jgi:CHAT domain-containing protein/tetratricopeptide (TPR) repeat protein